MTALRHAARILLVAVSLLAPHAYSASFSTDQSDLYYIPAESGWGIQLVQRGAVIFATMFVYGPGNTPTWYVATMNPTGGAFTWSGDLYATTGPYFAAVPFNPAAVTATKVGTMTWAAQTVTTGLLTYDVNGVGVAKNVIRQTLVYENYSGHFGGGIHETDTGCASPALNGTIENIGVLNIAQNGTTITMTAATSNGSCSYAGTLTQFGQMGDVVGTFACSNGANGSFHLFEFQVTEYSVIGRFTASYNFPGGCQATGWFGGLHVTTF